MLCNVKPPHVEAYGSSSSPRNSRDIMASGEKRRLTGLRLKAARLALGYGEDRKDVRNQKRKTVRNQTAFYKLFGYTIGRGNNWECGRAYPIPEFLVAMCDRFDVGPDWILCGRSGGLPLNLASNIIDNFNKLRGPVADMTHPSKFSTK